MQTKLATLRGQGQMATLDSILAAAGADVWSEEAVQAHKASELAKAPPVSRMWKWRHLFRNARKFVLGPKSSFIEYTELFTSFAFVIGVVVWLFAVPYAGTCALVCVAIALGCRALIKSFAGLQHIHIRGPAEWVSREAEGETMPKRAHELIASIKTFLPDSTFTLDKLVQGKEVLDPILKVSAVNPLTGQIETRAVLVWDTYGEIIAPLA